MSQVQYSLEVTFFNCYFLQASFYSDRDAFSQTQKHIVLHMIGHSLGLFHEHNRPDRDQFVEVRWNEIRAGQSNFFQKIPDNQVNSRNVPYDYLSIMHYGKSVSWNNAGLPFECFNYISIKQWLCKHNATFSLIIFNLMDVWIWCYIFNPLVSIWRKPVEQQLYGLWTPRTKISLEQHGNFPSET